MPEAPIGFDDSTPPDVYVLRTAALPRCNALTPYPVLAFEEQPLRRIREAARAARSAPAPAGGVRYARRLFPRRARVRAA